jgi:hypothetical protein
MHQSEQYHQNTFKVLIKDHILLLSLLGWALRLPLSYFVVGSNDVLNWERFARHIDGEGLPSLYSIDPLFNHPPLGALLVTLLYRASIAFNIPFPFTLRLPGLFGDLLLIFVLYQSIRLSNNVDKPSSYIPLYFAWSPIALLISGFHGNLDSFVTSLTFLALVMVENRRNSFLSGLLFGTALSIKLVPTPLLPLLIIKSKKRMLSLSGLILPLLSLFVCVFSIGSPFIRNVFNYAPPLEYWGIPALLLFLRESTLYEMFSLDFVTLFRANSVVAKGCILIGCFLLTLKNHTSSVIEIAALSFSIMLLLAPGFGPQYLIYPLPFLLSADIKIGLYYLVAGSFALIILYSSFLLPNSGFTTSHATTAPLEVIFLYGFIWILLLTFIISSIFKKPES